jgi:hypothetical protein
MNPSKQSTRGTRPANDFVAHVTDALEGLTSTQTSRSGHTAARVTSALANGVDPEVLALQMTKNSLKNNPNSPVAFTAAEMLTIAKLHAANKSRPALTRQQAGALVRGHKHDWDDSESLVAPA